MLHRVLAVGLLVLPGCALGPEQEPARSPTPPPYRPLPAAAASPGAVAAPDDGAGDASAAAAFLGEELAALDDDIDDEPDAPTASSPNAPRPRPTPQSPLLSLSDAELEARYKHDPGAVGSICAGGPRAGVLINGVQMPKNDRWILLDPGRAWGTRETVDSLSRIIDRVNERYPGTAPLPIGHISAQRGGHLSPHVSHQSGRDVDAGYYYRTQVRGFVSATADNLDMPRTWALIRSALKETDVDMIFIDSSVQRVLVDYAAQNGEDPGFLDESFQIRGKNARAPVRHINGHKNHVHFRFHSPVSEEMGRRLARHIVIPKAPVVSAHHAEVAGVAGATFANHKCRNGDTLVVLAKRYGTTVEDIQRVNGLKSNALKAGAIYKIPQKGPAKPAFVKPAPGRPAAVAKKAPPAHKQGSGRGASSQQR